MKKKFLGRLLTMLLIVSMTLTLLPVPAMAAYGSSSWGSWKEELRDRWNSFWYGDKDDTTDTAVQADTTDSYYRIVHLDCGRKYFTKDWIIALMTEAKAAGYNQIQLAFGNKGLRFLLDKMDVTVNGTTYASDKVTEAIQAGNKAYYDAGNANELTQTEMDDILAAAKTIGIEVVPLFNTPFHMEAVISAMETLGISNAYYSTNKACLNLSNDTATAFVKALMQKYVTYFSGKGCKYFSFGADEYEGGWDNTFYTYAGEIASMIKTADMTPRVFNDSYRSTDTKYINSVDEVCYWYTGYSGGDDTLYASASTLKNAGKKLINTNKDYYYVVSKTQITEWGSSQIQYVFSGPYDEANWINKAKKFNKNTFNNWASINDSDVTSAGSMFCIWCDNPGDKDETQIAKETRMILRVMAARMQDSNNYKASSELVDGGFDENGAIYHKALTVTGEGVTATKGQTVNASVAANKEITLTANEDVTWKYDSAVFTRKEASEAATAAYAAEETYKTYTGRSITLIPTGQAGDRTVTATNNDETVTIIVTVTEAEYREENVWVSVGGTSETFEHEGTLSATGGSNAIATANVERTTGAGKTNRTLSSLITNITNSETGVFCVNGYYLTMDDSGKIGATQDINAATKVTVTKSSNSYKIQANNYYLGIKSTTSGWSTTYTLTTSKSTSSSDVDFNWTFGRGYDYSQQKNGTWRVLVYDSGWKIGDNDWENAGKLYAVTETTTPGGAVTKVSFTGVAVGDTTYIIGDTKYIVHVSPAELKDQYIWINYFITDHPVTGSDNLTSKKVFAAEASGENGKALQDLIPQEGTDKKTSAAVKFYKAVAQVDGNIQQEAGWTNKVGAGFASGVEKVRYYNNVWSVYANGAWTAVPAGKSTTNFVPSTHLTEEVDTTGLAAITAYYAQKTTVTDDVTTYATDWGEAIGSNEASKFNEDYALLDFAVRYQSGSRTPDSFANEKTLVYNTNAGGDYKIGSASAKTRYIKDILVENTPQYEVYMITVTPSDELTKAAHGLTASSDISYPDENEKVVWVDNEAGLGDFTDESTHYTYYQVGGEPVVPNIIATSKHAYLVTYYVRVITEDVLTVHYCMSGSTDEKGEFYSYTIAVQGNTKFDSNFKQKTTNSLELVNNTVKNYNGHTETVSADLSTMPEIAASYRYVDYTCVGTKVSDNCKDVYLYYTFDNSAAFVIDFGLPLTITPGEVHDSLTKSGVTLTKVAATDVHCGTVTVNATDHSFTYTPNEKFLTAQDGDTFTLTYSGHIPKKGESGTQDGSVSYRVTILPASNVLYEENFLKEETGGSSTISWSNENFADHTTAQETQKVGEIGKNVFGYDGAYASSTGASGYWQLGSATEEGKKLSYNTFYSNYLSTTFFGNGFDLIGDCGPDTGRVLLLLTNKATGKGKLLDIDTRYNDGVGDYGTTTLNQVPLAHVMFDEEGTYTATIYAGGKAATTTSTQSGANGIAAYSGIATYAAAMPVVSYDDDVYAVLEANGLSMADVEYVNVSAADSTAVPAARRAAAAPTNGIATYAATDTTTEVKHAAGTHVEIDGFRVYRSSTNNTNYPAAEQNVKYWNILDVVKGNIVAYREGEGTESASVSVENYEGTGGPQNEIYLKPGQSVAFKLTDESIKSVQVSLRAVAGASSWSSTPISSNTEMYYTLNKDSEGNFTVSVPQDATGMLAIGNVKLPSSVTTDSIQSANEIATEELLLSVRMAMNVAPVDPEPEEPTVFAPELLDASVSTSRFFRNKYITLTVKASADVARLTVNGKELRPNNSWLVKKGWSDTYTYVLTETVKKNESRTYDIVAYDANGLASETKTLRAD